MATRAEVYAVVDGERDYQDARKGNAKRHDGQPDMRVDGYILCMEKCLDDARNAWYKGGTGGKDSLEFIRKVTALGVAAMEYFGAPPRA